MDLTHGEQSAIKRQNQRIKALGDGEVRIIWKNHQIEQMTFVATLTPTDIYETTTTGLVAKKIKEED